LKASKPKGQNLGVSKSKSLNRIAKICYGYLYLREENLSFDNNYMIKKLNFEEKIYQINHVGAESLAT